MTRRQEKKTKEKIMKTFLSYRQHLLGTGKKGLNLEEAIEEIERVFNPLNALLVEDEDIEITYRLKETS